MRLELIQYHFTTNCYFQPCPLSIPCYLTGCYLPLPHHLVRMCNPAGYRASRGDRRIGQVHLGFGTAHAPHEVAVGGGDTAFPVREDTHVPAQTRPAGGRAESRPRFNEYLDEPFF
jgi:hypothetical protein